MSGAGLKAAFEAKGYFAAVFPGALDREVTGLYRHLDLGRPLTVMLARRGGSHYLVLKGYDAENHLLLVVDPAKVEDVLP